MTTGRSWSVFNSCASTAATPCWTARLNPGTRFSVQARNRAKRGRVTVSCNRLLGGALEEFGALKKLGANRLKRREPEKTRKPGAFENALEGAIPLERARHEQPVEDAP